MTTDRGTLYYVHVKTAAKPICGHRNLGANNLKIYFIRFISGLIFLKCLVLAQCEQPNLGAMLDQPESIVITVIRASPWIILTMQIIFSDQFLVRLIFECKINP